MPRKDGGGAAGLPRARRTRRSRTPGRPRLKRMALDLRRLSGGGEGWRSASGRPVDLAIREHAVDTPTTAATARSTRSAEYLVPLFPAGGTVMTQCFGETIVGMMLKEAKLAGKEFRLFCPETRPYFQGARLTATVCRDMGFDVTVITDNMPAFVMERERDGSVHLRGGRDLPRRLCGQQGWHAADRHLRQSFRHARPSSPATPDQRASRRRTPSRSKCATRTSRLQAMGVRTAADGVKGYYPAFDMTPPHLISGIVTDRGVFSPFDLHRYFRPAATGNTKPSSAKAPLQGDSPYQGEMSRRDKRGRDAVGAARLRGCCNCMKKTKPQIQFAVWKGRNGLRERDSRTAGARSAEAVSDAPLSFLSQEKR